jgi:hypothetical protein
MHTVYCKNTSTMTDIWDGIAKETQLKASTWCYIWMYFNFLDMLQFLLRSLFDILYICKSEKWNWNCGKKHIYFLKYCKEEITITWSTIHCTIKYFSCIIASSCQGTHPLELKWYVKYSLRDRAPAVTVHKLPCNGLKWLSTNFLHDSTVIFLNLVCVCTIVNYTSCLY